MSEKLDSGKVFDYSKKYLQNPKEVKKLLDFYFSDKDVKNKIILDAGCRVGDYSKILVDKGAGKVIGIDLSKECVDAAKNRYKDIKKMEFIQGDIRNLRRFKDSSFDAVICVGTIFYLPPKEVRVVINEFLRVTKPNGTVLVLFQKEKGKIVKMARFIANKMPLKLYFLLIDKFAFLMKPAVKTLVGRNISTEYLKYDVLLSLKGINFGVPIKINKKFRVKTVKCEQCSEETTATYKIKVPKDKKID
ncbi:class I SAM-dependent methyltransferase [Candidatus Pacearchaeota archaeon]|nr:MAG: hypothetical protein UW10_C0007G0014 [Candidatus Magasanikbacteria bacterium GW2011_GWA2_43_9]MBS3071727.1 class I SAM-dependent methyltransferase [Candidatus Pacearchaeota archaeon]